MSETLALAPALEVANLKIWRGRGWDRQELVSGISFAVAEGEIFGIVGEIGAGKTTILKTIAGLHLGWRGAIRMRQHDLESRRPKRQQKMIQMVFEGASAALHPLQTIERMLFEGLVVQDMGDRDRRILRTLYDVGLPAKLRFRYPYRLSAGERRRAALACALIVEPRILLLDEPTAALDRSTATEILELLRQLRRQRQLSCILASQDLGVAAEICDRIAILRDGRFVEEHSGTGLRAAIPRDRPDTDA